MAATSLEQIKVLQDRIEREAEAYSRLIAVLTQEQQVLVAARPEGLQDIVAEKNRLLDQLTALSRDRQHAMNALGLPRDPDRAEKSLGRHPLAAAYRKLRDLARQSSMLNALNGRLANQKLQFVSARLDVLRGAAQRAGLYDMHGRAGDVSSTSRIIAAA